jgi:hypothetical protein
MSAMIGQIACFWFTMALGTFILVLMTSLLDIHHNGPIQIRESGKQGPFSSLWLLVLWPIILIMAARAAFKGKSLPRYIQETEDEMAAQKAEEEREKRERERKEEQLRLQGLPLRCSWHCPKEHPEPFPVPHHFLVAMFEPDRDHTKISHIVIEHASKFLAFRAMPEPVLSYQLQVCDTLTVAQQLCESDEEWIKLCAPGKELEQARACLGAHTAGRTFLGEVVASYTRSQQ